MMSKTRWIWFAALLVLATGCQQLQSLMATPTLEPFATATPLSLPTETPTLAVMLSTPTLAIPTLPVPTPTPAQGRIVGVVWKDLCPTRDGNPINPQRCRAYEGQALLGDGKRQDDEPFLTGVRVRLAKGGCPGTVLSETATDGEGRFAFEGLAPGTYCVSINAQDPANAPILKTGLWTEPPGNAPIVQQSATVQAGETSEVAFGYSELVWQPTPTPTSGPTPTTALIPPTPTATVRPTSPRELGEPTYLDTMDAPKQTWNLRWGDLRTYGSRGRLVLDVKSLSPGTFWIFSKYPALRNAYVEALFITGPNCAKKDRYGLVVRAPTPYEGYMFLVSCDGMMKILRWNGGLVVFKPWSWPVPLNPEEQGSGAYQTYPVHTGPNQVNRIGVWMEGDTLRMYINRILVAEIHDNFFTEGMIGLAVGADDLPFKVFVEELAYWELP